MGFRLGFLSIQGCWAVPCNATYTRIVIRLGDYGDYKGTLVHRFGRMYTVLEGAKLVSRELAPHLADRFRGSVNPSTPALPAVS